MMFLDLHKVYDTLDRSRCLEILESYGVGQSSIPDPPDILGSTEDRCEVGRLL